MHLPQNTLLLVLPVPLRMIDQELYFEEQACTGINYWADNFPYVVMASPLMPEDIARKETTISWKPISSIGNRDRIQFQPLPWGYSKSDFIKQLPKVRTMLRPIIQEATFLHFSPGGVIGDWGSIAAFEAYLMSKKYTTHMDWIGHRVMLQSLQDSDSILTRLKRHLHSLLARYWNNFLISRSALALCNGMSVYTYYSRINKNAVVTYDIHYSKENCASSELIAKKKAHALDSDTLTLCYTGRMVSMKAPLDWLKALSHATTSGARIKASWYGDGPLLPNFIEEIKRLSLKDIVAARGFEQDRKKLSSAVGDADLFLQTHIADESPRCIIESLMRGTPIIGYDSLYNRTLINGDAAGKLCPCGDWKGLGDLIVHLYRHRESIPSMIDHAAAEGKKYSEESLFKERAAEIRKAYSAY